MNRTSLACTLALFVLACVSPPDLDGVDDAGSPEPSDAAETGEDAVSPSECDSVVAYWSFDELNPLDRFRNLIGDEDLFAQSHDVEAVPEDGVRGGWADFEGAGHSVHIGKSEAFFLEEGTIVFWVRAPQPPGNESVILSRDQSGDVRGHGEIKLNSDQRLYGQIEDGMSGRADCYASPIVETNRWHEVVFSFGGESLATWLDGQPHDPTECEEYSGGLEWKNPDIPMVLGASTSSDEPGDDDTSRRDYFVGGLDEMWIFRRAYDRETVADLIETCRAEAR